MKLPDISKELFGGVLVSDAAGFYPGLEFLNLVFCVADGAMLPPPGAVQYRLRSQEFARKLVWSEGFLGHPHAGHLFGDSSRDVLQHLLKCLQLRIPNMSKEPDWDRAHFFPYTKTLIHWDARKKKGNKEAIDIERRYLRGAGAYAFSVLRQDPDSDRLEKIRNAFSALYPSEPSPLERLAQVLENNSLIPGGQTKDGAWEEQNTRVKGDEDEETFRDGILNILTQSGLSVTARVTALMSWVGLWLMTVQVRRACDRLGRKHIPLLVDCGTTPGQLRRESYEALSMSVNSIREAADNCQVEDSGEHLTSTEKAKLSAFFTGTGATIGLVNAFSGRRFFVAGLDLMEMLVMAGTNERSELPFASFTRDWLFRKCHLVFCKDAAEELGLLEQMDASIFEDNEQFLAQRMKAQGLLSDYSDSTRMVSLRGLA